VAFLINCHDVPNIVLIYDLASLDSLSKYECGPRSGKVENHRLYTVP
jgi:hypothetical protein